MLSTFATNSINILAGINGSEVSQALIIALSVIVNDLIYLPWPFNFRVPLHLLGSQDIGGVWSAGMAHGSQELVERHLFSLYFMLPLVAVCAGFMYHNWRVRSFHIYARHSYTYCVGTPPVHSLVIHCAMFREWLLRLWASRLTSQKPYFCSLCRRYSTSSSHVPSYLVLSQILDTECQGVAFPHTFFRAHSETFRIDLILTPTSSTLPRLYS